MASERFAAWVTETKETLVQLDKAVSPQTIQFCMTRCVVYALLTIAIAIHEATQVAEDRRPGVARK